MKKEWQFGVMFIVVMVLLIAVTVMVVSSVSEDDEDEQQGDTTVIMPRIMSTDDLPEGVDILVVIDPETNVISLPDEEPWLAGTGIKGKWVMGDWDGDGVETLGVYDQGAFFYTNRFDTTPPDEWPSIWLSATEGAPVAGRLLELEHDCVGLVVENNQLWWTCELDIVQPAMNGQWIGSLLADQSGGYEFAVGDWDGDGLETMAVRRGDVVTWTNDPVTVPVATFPGGQAIGKPHNDQHGQLVAGDWDNDGIDTFGQYYSDGYLYYRNDLEWNTGVWDYRVFPVGPYAVAWSP